MNNFFYIPLFLTSASLVSASSESSNNYLKELWRIPGPVPKPYVYPFVYGSTVISVGQNATSAMAVDVDTGLIKWSTPFPESVIKQHFFSNLVSIPDVPDVVLAAFDRNQESSPPPSPVLIAFNAKTGKILWEKHLHDIGNFNEYGIDRLFQKRNLVLFGYSYRGTIDNVTAEAIDVTTGKESWRWSKETDFGYVGREAALPNGAVVVPEVVPKGGGFHLHVFDNAGKEICGIQLQSKNFRFMPSSLPVGGSTFVVTQLAEPWGVTYEQSVYYDTDEPNCKARQQDPAANHEAPVPTWPVATDVLYRFRAPTSDFSHLQSLVLSSVDPKMPTKRHWETALPAFNKRQPISFWNFPLVATDPTNESRIFVRVTFQQEEVSNGNVFYLLEKDTGRLIWNLTSNTGGSLLKSPGPEGGYNYLKANTWTPVIPLDDDIYFIHGGVASKPFSASLSDLLGYAVLKKDGDAFEVVESSAESIVGVVSAKGAMEKLVVIYLEQKTGDLVARASP